MSEHPKGDQSAADEAWSYRLMCLIKENPEYSQRRLAEIMGVSLGKTHYLLKALFTKGMVKAERLGQQPSKILYVLTPEGLRHRVLLTRQFLARKEGEFVRLQLQIEQLRGDLGRSARNTSEASLDASTSDS